MSTTEPLLPCPFCGGEAEIWRASADPKRPAWVGCMGRCAVLVSREYETTEEAIAAWNRRTPPAAVPEGLMDALKCAEKALRPFFNAVYNDNGYMTVHGGYPYYDAIAGYYAYKRVRDAISAAPAAPTEARA